MFSPGAPPAAGRGAIEAVHREWFEDGSGAVKSMSILPAGGSADLRGHRHCNLCASQESVWPLLRPGSASRPEQECAKAKSSIFTPVLIAGCVILLLNFAIRASFGVFQIPIATEFNWLRSDFSLAIAIQNLAWGIGQPIFGALAEKFGDRRAIITGALLYAAGLVLSSFAVTPGEHQLLEILVGFGIAGTGFGVIPAIVGRAAKPENRSLALGIATVAGSAGQVIGAPAAEILLQYYPWQTVFVIFAVVILCALFALPFLRSPTVATRQELEESLGTVLIRAFRDPSYSMIFMGLFPAVINWPSSPRISRPSSPRNVR